MMIRKRFKIKNSRLKIRNAEKQGAALLVVLFVIMTITILSLGFLSRSDVELACGENMILRSQMDYLAESGLVHARGLILHSQDAGSEYWTGAVGQQLAAGSDDYYDVEIVRNDSDPANRCNYIIDCNSYRLKNGERIGSSSIRAELRLDPCIAYWAGLSTIISPLTVVNGDVYCAGNLSNSGSINGDVFAAGTITGTNIRGQKDESVAQAPVAWLGLEASDFSSTYYIGSVSYGVDLVGSSVHPSGSFNPSGGNPSGVRYHNGDLELLGNVDIEGMLVVNGTLKVSGGNNVISAVKNFPALLVNGDMAVESSSSLELNGLVVIKGQMQVSADSANVSIVGGLFVEDGIVQTTADSSGNGNTGMLYNGPTWRPAGGKTDGALEFGGVNDKVEDSDAGSYLNGLSAITVSLWIKSDVMGENRGILFVREPTGIDEYLGIRYDKNGVFGGGVNGIKASVRTTLGYTQIESSSDVQTTGWQHLALLWEAGSGLRLYINGQLDTPRYDRGALSGIVSGVQKLIVGRGSKGEYWDGLIDDVRIYNCALDVNDIYPPEDGLSGLVGHWKLDDSGSNITITAAPSKTAIEVWPQAGVAQRWEQAGGAFFRSIERK